MDFQPGLGLEACGELRGGHTRPPKPVRWKSHTTWATELPLLPDPTEDLPDSPLAPPLPLESLLSIAELSASDFAEGVEGAEEAEEDEGAGAADSPSPLFSSLTLGAPDGPPPDEAEIGFSSDESTTASSSSGAGGRGSPCDGFLGGISLLHSPQGSSPGLHTQMGEAATTQAIPTAEAAQLTWHPMMVA